MLVRRGGGQAQEYWPLSFREEVTCQPFFFVIFFSDPMSYWR